MDDEEPHDVIGAALSRDWLNGLRMLREARLRPRVAQTGAEKEREDAMLDALCGPEWRNWDTQVGSSASGAVQVSPWRVVRRRSNEVWWGHPRRSHTGRGTASRIAVAARSFAASAEEDGAEPRPLAMITFNEKPWIELLQLGKEILAVGPSAGNGLVLGSRFKLAAPDDAGLQHVVGMTASAVDDLLAGLEEQRGRAEVVWED